METGKVFSEYIIMIISTTFLPIIWYKNIREFHNLHIYNIWRALIEVHNDTR